LITEAHKTKTANIHNDFYVAKTLLYDVCGFELTNPLVEKESSEYGACCFNLNGHKVRFRVSKITPSKTGQFVSIWKRDEQGITQPFHEEEDFDLVIISCKTNENFGQFIFAKEVLMEKGIITGRAKKGKCGIRVYPPWDKTMSKQAEKTQRWQTNYFLRIDNSIDFEAAKKLVRSTTYKNESNIT
jgi:hypothetical protein